MTTLLAFVIMFVMVLVLLSPTQLLRLQEKTCLIGEKLADGLGCLILILVIGMLGTVVADLVQN